MWGALGGKGYPEIVDFNVLEKFRNKGVGTKLMDIAEQASPALFPHGQNIQGRSCGDFSL